MISHLHFLSILVRDFPTTRICGENERSTDGLLMSLSFGALLFLPYFLSLYTLRRWSNYYHAWTSPFLRGLGIHSLHPSVLWDLAEIPDSRLMEEIASRTSIIN